MKGDRMDAPNEEQIKSSVRWTVTTFGGAIAGWGAHAGWLTSDQVLGVLNSETFVGGAAAVVAGAWSLFVHKQSNAVAVVAKIAANPESPVKAPILENTPEGRTLAQKIRDDDPASVVVVAGTPAAAAAAAH